MRAHVQSSATAVVAALLAVTAGCGDDSLNRFEPRIQVDPTEIDFGDGVVDRDNPVDLTVRNIGSGRLELTAFRFEPDNGIFRILDAPDGVAAAAEDVVVVSFIPTTPKEIYDATLFIDSNDPAEPTLAVPLRGVGGIREIEVFPESIDFGVVDEGIFEIRTLEIRNIGGDPLIVSSLTFTSTSADLALAPGTFTGGTIEALTSTTVTLRYSPVDLGADQALITINSNDEDEPVVEVPVRARGNLAPRAIAWGCETEATQIGCDGVEKIRRLSLGIRERVGLDGRESFDPENQDVTFNWEVVEHPAGAVIGRSVFHSTDDRVLRQKATGDLEVDAVGRFDIRLIVKDARGLESFDTPESHILIAPKDLELLLRWDIATDVDLHLVRPGGTVGDYGNGQVGSSTGTDCSTFNRAPNWNDLATRLDDPSLDIDIVDMSGDEIASLNAPETGDVYKVYAHYCDSRDVQAITNVTIEVYVRGELVATVPENGFGYSMAPGELWEGALVRWDPNGPNGPTVDVTDQSQSSSVMMPSLCRQN